MSIALGFSSLSLLKSPIRIIRKYKNRKNVVIRTCQIESLITSSVSATVNNLGLDGFLILERMAKAVHSPRSVLGVLIVVKGGSEFPASGISSKPTKDMSLGIAYPQNVKACIRWRAVLSFPHTVQS